MKISKNHNSLKTFPFSCKSLLVICSIQDTIFSYAIMTTKHKQTYSLIRTKETFQQSMDSPSQSKLKSHWQGKNIE